MVEIKVPPVEVNSWKLREIERVARAILVNFIDKFHLAVGDYREEFLADFERRVEKQHGEPYFAVRIDLPQGFRFIFQEQASPDTLYQDQFGNLINRDGNEMEPTLNNFIFVGVEVPESLGAEEKLHEVKRFLQSFERTALGITDVDDQKYDNTTHDMSQFGLVYGWFTADKLLTRRKVDNRYALSPRRWVLAKAPQKAKSK